MREWNVLIHPEVLADALGDEQLTLVDAGDRDRWLRTRIPGAVHIDPTRFNARDGDVVGLLPELKRFDETAAELGLDSGCPVVVYDETGGPPAGRAAWTLQAFGHPRVALLDGGLQNWVNHGYPTRGGPPAKTGRPPAGAFRGLRPAARVADAGYIMERLNRPDVQIVDARSAAEYRGEDIRSRRGGHIPGAINLDWNATKRSPGDGRFKTAAELDALIEDLGLEPSNETICYCQSHQRSALLCLLLESLGFENVKGYPGAWSDWGNRDDTPVESTHRRRDAEAQRSRK